MKDNPQDTAKDKLSFAAGDYYISHHIETRVEFQNAIDSILTDFKKEMIESCIEVCKKYEISPQHGSVLAGRLSQLLKADDAWCVEDNKERSMQITFLKKLLKAKE
jgi:flavorubredoxin